jgi:chitosanase
MSNQLSFTVLCEDCDDRKEDLQLRGYEVVDPCAEDKTQPGMCVIRYRRRADAATGAVATVATGPARETAAPAPAAESFEEPPATATQASAAKAIVNLFETGQVLGDYGAVTVLPGDTGHLTYGRSQTTLGSGNLAVLLDRYCTQPGARFGARLRDWRASLKAGDKALDRDQQLHNLLRACADDPVMRDVQDRFFDDSYWQPALRAAARLGIRLPLGVAIVYDSWVHGAWGAMRDRTDRGGTVQQSGEKEWLERYVDTRRDWLATHPNLLLRKTVYRMDAFRGLMDQGYWGLELPLVVRGREISLATLSGVPPGCYDGPQPGTRPLAVQSPLNRGLDVRLLQLGLSLADHQCDIRADGIFGSGTARWVKRYQQVSGLPQTGVADPALVARLAAV